MLHFTVLYLIDSIRLFSQVSQLAKFYLTVRWSLFPRNHITSKFNPRTQQGITCNPFNVMNIGIPLLVPQAFCIITVMLQIRHRILYCSFYDKWWFFPFFFISYLIKIWWWLIGLAITTNKSLTIPTTSYERVYYHNHMKWEISPYMHRDFCSMPVLYKWTMEWFFLVKTAVTNEHNRHTWRLRYTCRIRLQCVV